MLVDSALTLSAGLISAGSNKEYKPLSIVIFVSFAMLQVYSDIILKTLQMTQEAAIYVAYGTIQVAALYSFKYIKSTKLMKCLLSSTLIVNGFMTFHYIIVVNFGEMGFNFHAAYNPVVWFLMLSQLIHLLWIERDVVAYIRKRRHVLWANRPFSFLDRIMHSDRNTNRSSK